MRLAPEHALLIKQQVQAVLGPGAQVRLFGSRTDDAARGGDIDLHVSVGSLVPRSPFSVLTTARLAALLERQLGGRKVDIRLWSEGQPLLPIDQVALSQGIPL